MLRKKLLLCLAAAAMAVGSAGCSDSASSSASKEETPVEEKDQSTLIVGTVQELAGNFSPIFYQTSYDMWVVNLVYNSMLKFDADSALTTDLAEEMPEVSEDGKTVTFKLRKGIKFSDGSDLTADDVKFTFTLLSDPTYDGYFSVNADFIDGYEAYHDGDAEELSGIEVVDDYTVVFHLNVERIDTVQTLGIQGILSDTQYEYTKGNLGGYKENCSQPVGTNAYVLNSYEKASGASLVRNENYTGSGEYAIDRVVIKTIAAGQELISLENGDINYYPETVDPNIIGPASLIDGLTFNSYFRAAEGFMCFNCADGPTADPAVRQAMAYAVNRSEFVDSYFKFPEGSEKLDDVALGYVPAAYWNPVSAEVGEYVTGTKKLDGLETYEYNPEKAAQLLEEAGWTDTDGDGIRDKDGKKLQIKFLSSEGNAILEMLLPMIIKTWKDVGIELIQTAVDFNTLLATVDPLTGNTSDWNAFFMSMSYMGTADADSVANLQSHAPYNYSQLSDEKLDTVMTEGLRTTDAALSTEKFKEALIIENEQMPYLATSGNNTFNIYSDQIKGMKTGPVRNWSLALDTAYIE